MEHIVMGCNSCPFFEDEYNTCNHPIIDNWVEVPYKHNSNQIEMDCSGDEMSYIEFPITPDWCPLKKEPITIIFS